MLALFNLPSPAGASVAVGGVGLIVFLIVVRGGAPGALLVVVLLPFHKFAIALLDHTLVPLPDVRTDVQLEAVVSRIYLLDAAVLGGLVLGALAVACRGVPGPLSRRRVLAVVLAGSAAAVTVIGLLVGGPSPRAMGFSLMLDIAGPLTLLSILCVQPDRYQTLRARNWLLAALSVIALVALAEQLSTTALATWIRADTPSATSAFYAGLGTDYRSGSLLATPLELSFLLGAGVPLALSAVIGGSQRARQGAALALGVIVAGLAVTFTRSGFLGAGAGIACVLVVSAPGWRKNMLTVGLIATAIAALFVAVPRITDLHLSHGTDTEHFAAMRTDLDLIRDKPQGHGLGTIDTIGQVFAPAQAAAVSSEDEFLAKGVEGGIAAMVLDGVSVLGVLAGLIGTGVAARRRGDAEMTGLAAGAAGSLVALAVCGVFIGVDDLSFLCMTWAMSGVALSQPRWERRREARRLRDLSPAPRAWWAPPLPGQPLS